MVTHREINNSLVYLYFDNRVYLGSCRRLEDGYFVFDPNGVHGYWTEHSLRLLADKLNELNKTWDEKVKEFLNGKI